jgi:enamidase
VSTGLTLRNATLFDGSGDVRPGAAIAIAGDRIAPAIDAGAPVLDLAGAAVIPGLIDLHVHVGAVTADDVGRPDAELHAEYLAHRPRVRDALVRAGVTTIRSVGDIDQAIVRMRRARLDDRLDGPRVHCVGPIFTAVGGHPVSSIYARHPELAAMGARQCSDAAAARREVAVLAPHVDGIKAVYSGQPRMPAEILYALGEEARRHDLWFAVHTGTPDEVREAARAGASTVEHGVTSGDRLDDAVLAELRDRHVTYVPTLAIQATRVPSPRFTRSLENVRLAVEAGCRIGVGSDAQGPQMRFGEALASELTWLVHAGMAPVDVLVAATAGAARVLGCERDLGTIVPGALADVVVIDGRPWQDIADLRRVRLVVQGGRIVYDAARGAGASA